MQAAGIRCFSVTSADAARSAFADAVTAARQGTPAALLLPVNVQLASTCVPIADPPHPAQPARRPEAARAQSINAAVALLQKSQRFR